LFSFHCFFNNPSFSVSEKQNILKLIIKTDQRNVKQKNRSRWSVEQKNKSLMVLLYFFEAMRWSMHSFRLGSTYKKILQNSERALSVFLSIANYSAEFMQNQYKFYPAEKKLLFFARDDQNFTLQKKSYYNFFPRDDPNFTLQKKC